MHWTWDDLKNQINQKKHGLSFETARRVFDDPSAASRPDPYRDEERWQTMGVVGHVLILVAHTFADIGPETGDEGGRIISARKATAHERKIYEEGDF